jgi:hypothetical protein
MVAKRKIFLLPGIEPWVSTLQPSHYAANWPTGASKNEAAQV